MFRRLATVGMLAALVLVMSCGESARLPDPSPQTTSATSPSTGAPTPTTRPEPAEARPEAPATAEPSTFLTVGSGAFLGRVVSVDFG
ncbi:MAG: hypothetical protein Q8Q52_04700, partial [Acidimicrobiia bacterium]|nr:hypothetical protein [Acidimicrobiia bacterium]